MNFSTFSQINDPTRPDSSRVSGQVLGVGSGQIRVHKRVGSGRVGLHSLRFSIYILILFIIFVWFWSNCGVESMCTLLDVKLVLNKNEKCENFQKKSLL